MMYKIGLTHKRQDYHVDLFRKEFEGQYKKNEEMYQTKIDEVNNFVKQLQWDLGEYSSQNKKDRQDMVRYQIRNKNNLHFSIGQLVAGFLRQLK